MKCVGLGYGGNSCCDFDLTILVWCVLILTSKIIHKNCVFNTMMNYELAYSTMSVLICFNL